MTYDRNVPIDWRGHLVCDPEFGTIVRWERNSVFQAEMRLVDFRRVGNSTHAVWERMGGSALDGATYDMFSVDLLKLLQTATVVKGRVTGSWTFCKRGRCYGIQLVALKIGGEKS